VKNAIYFTISLIVGFCVARVICGCTPSTTPTTVYGALVDAGCLAATPDGVQAITDEHAMPGHPPWLDCMWAGGTVKSCSVPCQ
jgi:hypothetical protein